MIWQTRTLATYISAAAPIGGEDGNPLLDMAAGIGELESMRGLPEDQQDKLAEKYARARGKKADQSEKAGDAPQRLAEPKTGSFEAFMSTFGRVAHK